MLTKVESGSIPEIALGKPVSKLNLSQIGYWGLLLLALSLPFELTQKPLFSTPFLVVTNLKLVFLLAAFLAVLTLLQTARPLLRKPRDHSNYLYRQRWAILTFGLLLVSSLISSVLAGQSSLIGQGFKWSFHFLLGGLIWMAIPIWLGGTSQQTERKVRWLTWVLIGGGVIAASVGLLEFLAGLDFAESLGGWFKIKPTEAGPFLRLSGTFEYANIAAIYCELVLPFALFNLAELVQRGTRSRFFWPLLAMWSGAILILLAATLLTLTRGAWLGTAVGLVAMVIVTRRAGTLRRHWWLVLGLFAVLAVGGELLATATLPQFGPRFSSQSDQDWYRASYTSSLPTTLTACQLITVPVTVSNISPLDWQLSQSKPYNLGYHWLDDKAKMVDFEGIRTPLPRAVPAGENITLSAQVKAPQAPGQYQFVWDMVQEDVSWFSLKSSLYTAIPVTVTAGTACNNPTQPVTTNTATNPDAGKPAPQVLPQVLVEPDRPQLWQAALSMVSHKPLFGVGPDGFRLNYGYYSQPPLITWDTRIFANSLPLEILADLGLVGGVLFGLLLGLVGWSLLKLFWSGRNAISYWQVALLGAAAAFLGHGVVDYFFGSTAIFILFWILLGLASTKPVNNVNQITVEIP